MAGNETPSPTPDPIEERLLRRFRLVAIGVILLMVVLSVVADTLGRLFISSDFHSSEVIFGTLIGALTLLLGVEGLSRIGGKK